MQGVIRAFNGKPFAPSSDFLLSTAQHKQLVEALWTAARKSVPLVVLIGAEGVGKTVLVHHLAATAPPDVAVGILSTESVDGSGPSRVITAAGPEVTIEHGATNSEDLEVFLEDGHRSGRKLLLIVDDAEKASDSTVDTLVSLLEPRSDGTSSLTVVLVGSPRLEALLNGPKFDTLTCRRGVIFRFQPMRAEETAAYVHRRLQTAGIDAETFEEAALQAIHNVTGGLPKRVDILCSHALAAMHRERKHIVDRAQIDALIAKTHRRKDHSEVTEGSLIGYVSDLEQPRQATPTPDGFPEDHASVLPVIEPCEFVFLARDRAETTSPETRQVPGSTSHEERREKAAASSRTAADRLRGLGAVVHQGTERPNVPNMAVPAVNANAATAAATPPRHRSPHAGLRPVYAILGGIAAVAAVGVVVVNTIEGGRTGVRESSEAGDFDQQSRAEVSGAGSALVGGLSSTDGVFAGGSGSNNIAPDVVASSEVDGGVVGSGTSEAWQDASGALDTKFPPIGALEMAPPDRVGADRLFRQGLELAVEDPSAAAVAFSRAAIRGHSRSAYYLGQIYETGDGVPADTALALAWYGLAGDQARARQRLDELAEHRVSLEHNRGTDGGDAPLLAFAERSKSGVVELIWTGGLAAGPIAGYVVELAETPEAPPFLRTVAEVPALRLVYSGADELWWRVIRGDGTAASVWQSVPYTD